jgi:hypothetical protein
MVRRNRTKYFAAFMIVLVVIAVLPVTVRAQERKIELTPTISYMWAGSYHTIDGDISLEDGTQYGGIIGYPVAPQVRLEFFYATLSSRTTFVPYYVGKPSTLDGLDIPINVHYFQLGGVHYIDKGKVQPFIGIAAGAVLFHPKEDRYQGYTLQDSWNFAMSAIGGLTISVSDAVGLRLQGRLLLPLYFSGGGIWVGTGGASVGVSAGVPIVQGDVGAGITIRF